MKQSILLISNSIIVLFFSFLSTAQSIHQEQLSHYNASGESEASFYESLPFDTIGPVTKVGCNLTKMVYGWHPYWVGSAYQNYQWDLLSHLSFFSYEVDATSGNPISTHGWSTSAAVNAALASGSTKVTLCVTLFANHATFLGNATARQTLISNLINLISTRGAHGVNIDFEGLPSSQSTNFANFMVDLANQMHTAIPGSEVSTVLYSVDWNSVFNFSIMEPEVDYYIIMGYDYYYSGSTTAGPNDPLYQFGTSYNYTLSRSITEYTKAGCPKNKLILGLPNYGREWSTSSLTVPSATTASGVSRTYAYIQNNSTGFYSATNHTYDNDSHSDMYLFQNGSTPKQCFITEEGAFEKRLQHVLNAGIGGIGIWALGYDDGYLALWDAIESKMTDCYADPCSGTIHDFGGPTKNYYNGENYTWTIAPPGATSLDISFTSFDLETNYDYLYVYDGASIASPQIPGSPFTGVISPGNFSTSTGAITFKFTSDISTTKPGFNATYTCNQDDLAPQTDISVNSNWQTQDFTVNYTDTDNEGINRRFSLITDFNGSQRTANRSLGYLYEDFSSTLGNQWSTGLGNWSVQSGKLSQTSETETNTACNSTLTQDANGIWVYHFKGKIGGSGTNKRAGIHFFCSDPSLPNRGNSYLVYWRTDSDKCQIYRSTNDNLVLQTDDPVLLDPNTEYDLKVIYDPSTGLVEAYVNDERVSYWVDPIPLTVGGSVSLRTGNCNFVVDNIKVLRSRSVNQLVSVGTNNQARYQNENPFSPNCFIYSLVQDVSLNFSQIDSLAVNIDWTAPSSINVNDGLSNDIDFFVTQTEIAANWTASSDVHSGIDEYLVAVGTSFGAQDIVSYTAVGNQLNHTFTGLNLIVGQMYYVSVKAVNGSGLESILSVSDGQVLQVPTMPPLANFFTNESVVCFGDSVALFNTSTDGISFVWSTSNGVINDPSIMNTYLTPINSGVYSVTLEAANAAGTNQITLNLNITVLPGPTASAIPDGTLLSLPNAIVLFDNTSQNADEYYWEFGDGEVSFDENPWHQYVNEGMYTVMLVASRNGCLSDTTYFVISVGLAVLSEIKENTISIFPNPTKNDVTIEGSFIEEVVLYDMQGKILGVYNGGGSSSLTLQLEENISHGFYMLKIKNQGIFLNRHLIKL